MRSWILLVLLMSAYVRAGAQPQPYFGYETHISELFDIEDEVVNDIEEDWNGFIWMATLNGLYRFDGTTIKHYTHASTDTTLPHQQVFDVLVDHDRQQLWIATALGMSRLDPVTERAETYQTDFENPHSIADNIVRYIFKDNKQQIWVCSYNHGLSLYREASNDFQNFYFDFPHTDSLQKLYPTINNSRLNSYRYMVQDPADDDLYWLASPLGLISFHQKTKQFSWPFADNKDPNFRMLMHSVSVIHLSGNQMLIGTHDQGYEFEPTTGAIHPINIPAKGGVRLDYVTQFHEVSPGQVLISFQNGLAQYDIKNFSIQKTWKDSPSTSAYFGIRLIDSQQRIWVHSSGVTVMYDPLKQITEDHYPSQGTEGKIRVFKQLSEEAVGILTSKPNYYHSFNLNSKTWITQEMKAGNINWDAIRWNDAIRLDDNHWILLSESQVFKLNPATRVLSRFNIPVDHTNPGFTKALLDTRGFLWIATRRIGLFKVDLKTNKTVHYLDELNSPYSSSLYTWITDLHLDDQGYVWVRLARSYAIYQHETNDFQIFSHYQSPEKTFRYIRNFAASPSGDIWISSEDSGFGKTDKDQLSEGVLKKITVRNGLMSEQIFQLDFDKEGIAWILSDKGFSTYDPANETIFNYPWDRGIPRSTQFILMENGKIALALDQAGIGILDPALMMSNRTIPVPYISAIKINDEVQIQGGNRLGLQNVRIESDRDYISFEFSALGYANPKQFAYQLEGVDADWVETFDHRSTSYSNLSPGNYTFLLKSRLEGDIWSEVKQVNLFLAPRWYETIWFKAGLILFILLVGYTIYRSRLEEARRTERVKAEFQRKLEEAETQALRAQMNPHFLFNSLNSIQLYIIKNEPEKAVDYLERFSRLMRLILQNSRAKTVPLKDELEALRLYMEMENLRFSVKFDHLIHVDPSINQNDIEIPPMLLQPFVENAIWHGIQHKDDESHSEVVVSVSSQKDHLVCTIQDDGIGREAARQLQKSSIKKHKSMGMNITRNRLQMLNEAHEAKASIKIIDLYDQYDLPAGTKVVLTLPL